MLRSQLLKLVLVTLLFFFSSASARNDQKKAGNISDFAAKSLNQFQVFDPGSWSHHYGLQEYVRKYNRMQNEKFRMIKQQNKGTLQHISKVFKSYKLPAELKYLAIVESELKSTATSRVGALGVWQLMPQTAIELGLTVDSTNDERLNLHKSTKAAALYLRDLYRTFDDWALAVAAYNCGPGPVYKAIKKADSRSYWDLQEYLPKETRNHIKKLMATQVYFEGKSSFSGEFKLSGEYDGALAGK